MKTALLILLSLLIGFSNSDAKDWKLSELKSLTPQEERVIVYKGTERPFSGKYDKFKEEGTYSCKRCNLPLYNSDSKFDSGCGWPAFDSEIEGAVKRVPDADGRRVEITCNNCGAHLGHVFKGEKFTPTNTRHCVNSISLEFEPKKQSSSSLKKAYFAGGCFWGVEYYMEQLNGVKDALSGYMGGHTKNPTYRDISYKKTGHFEVVEVTYDEKIISYEDVAKQFFEIHDPTQGNGQGPDIGEQYKSALFYNTQSEKKTALKLVNILTSKGYDVKTLIRPYKTFYKAEDYHQDYYSKNKKAPYCHSYQKKFD